MRREAQEGEKDVRYYHHWRRCGRLCGIKPVCEVAEFEIQDSLLLNCSIGVDNTPQDGMEGRANMNQGFTDIWGNEY